MHEPNYVLMFLFQHISCHNLDLLSNYTYVMLVEFLRLTNLSVYVKHWYGHKNESVDRIYKSLVQTFRSGFGCR